MKHPIRAIFAFLAFSVAAFAGELSVSTLNAYFCFSPAYPGGSLKKTPRPESQEEYTSKIENLSGLVINSDIVALQEVEKQSVSDFATELKYKQAFVKGRDTFTGQDVGVLTNQGVTISSHGRVKELDKLVSKHILVKAKLKDGTVVHVLAVHLIRPIGDQAEKQAAQRDAIIAWAEGLVTQGEHVIVLGDFNQEGHNLLGGKFTDVLSTVKSPKTGLFGKDLDHIFVSPSITIRNVTIKSPPYGKKPNDLNKRLWSDHFAITAKLETN